MGKRLGYELPGGRRTMSRKAQFHYRGGSWGQILQVAVFLKTPKYSHGMMYSSENVFVATQGVTPELAKMVARFRLPKRC
jgi:hypothetical protein